MIKTGIGQDSHRFETEKTQKKLILGGVVIDDVPALAGNSDADVILHCVCNAISGISGKPILGPVSDKMCLDDGITDSAEYLKAALKTLGQYSLVHLSISIEALRPKIIPLIPAIRENVANLCGLKVDDVCVTATSGEQLTDFGRGLGMQVFVVATGIKNDLYTALQKLQSE